MALFVAGAKVQNTTAHCFLSGEISGTVKGNPSDVVLKSRPPHFRFGPCRLLLPIPEPALIPVLTISALPAGVSEEDFLLMLYRAPYHHPKNWG